MWLHLTIVSNFTMKPPATLELFLGLPLAVLDRAALWCGRFDAFKLSCIRALSLPGDEDRLWTTSNSRFSLQVSLPDLGCPSKRLLSVYPDPVYGTSLQH